LEDRLLERYKRFGFPLLDLNGQRLEQEANSYELKRQFADQKREIEGLRQAVGNLYNTLEHVLLANAEASKPLTKEDMERFLKNQKEMREWSS
jgi:hypothetical protein